MSKLLSRLSKSEILNLPGFDKYQSLTIRKLRPFLRQRISDLGVDFRGVKVIDYIKKFDQKSSDDKLFKRIAADKESLKNQHRNRE